MHDRVLYVVPSREGRCLAKFVECVRDLGDSCERLHAFPQVAVESIIFSGEMIRSFVSVVWVQLVNTLAFEVWE